MIHSTVIEVGAVVPERVELRYCFACDADAPHLPVSVEGVYVFQCRSCFASCTEPLEAAAAPHGRHRTAA